MKKISKKALESAVKKGAFLVDMRSPVDYRDGTISGAVNLPLRNFLNKIIGMDRKTRIVIFSKTGRDVELSQAYNYAEQLGFENISVSSYEELIMSDGEAKLAFSENKKPINEKFGKILGKTLDKANHLMNPSWSVRQISVDGKIGLVRQDYQANRINVHVENGLVVKIDGIG